MSKALVRVQEIPLPWAHTTNPVDRYLATLAPGSRPAQRNALDIIASTLGTTSALFPWHAMSVSVAAAMTTKLKEKYASATTMRMLAAVRGVLDVVCSERWFIITPEASGYVPSQLEHFTALRKVLRVKKTKGRKVGRVITDDDMKALMTSCASDGDVGARDAAILALGIGAGLRREEIADLLIPHVDLKTGMVQVVAGKGDKHRLTVLPPGGVAAVKRWLKIVKDEQGHVIRRLHAKEGISPKAVWEAIRNRVRATDVKPFTPHDMRRTFATRQLRAGTPMKQVQEAMGHANLQTTAGYDLTGVDQMASSIRKVDVPFGDQ